LMPDGLYNHSRFEQYWSGLYLREAAPPLISRYIKAPYRLFFALSERGALQHAPELKLIKHTTQQNYDNYSSGVHYRRLASLKYFGNFLQDCVPFTGQMLSTIWNSRRLTLMEKLALTARCMALFIRYPLYIEVRDRIPPQIRRLVRAPLRKLKQATRPGQ
jgi:hypothetical protein